MSFARCTPNPRANWPTPYSGRSTTSPAALLLLASVGSSTSDAISAASVPASVARALHHADAASAARSRSGRR